MSEQLLESALKILSEEGDSGYSRIFVALLNEVMRYERSQVLSAGHYERNDDRKGYANGFKNKTLRTSMGALDFDVPQVRGGVSFYPSALEKGVRSERALKVAIAEMYVQGVSTRKVTAVFEKMCGLEVTSSEVSRASKLLDEELTAWRNRPLGKHRYVYFDARYEKVREGGIVVDKALLIAVGVNEEGKREVLGVSTSASEAEVHWRAFFEALQTRGLHGIELFTSDAHSGLKAALNAVFPSIPWQRCQFHLQQNAQAYVPKIAMKKEVAADIRNIFNAPDLANANAYLKVAIEKHKTSATKLVDWMEKNIPQGLTVFAFPEHMRKKLRTTNCVERLNREIYKRTKVVSIFPNEEALLRLASAVIVENSDEWVAGKTYINLKGSNE